MYRTRLRFNNVPADEENQIVYQPFGGPDAGTLPPFYYRNSPTSPVSEMREVITDVADESHKEWHDVAHYGRRFVTKPTMQGFWILTQGPTNDPYHYRAMNTDPYLGYIGQFGLTGAFNDDLSGYGTAESWLLREPENLNDLETMAYKTMVPNIKAELSLPNSLYELKDFERLPALLRDIRKVFYTKLTLRQYTRTGAQGYLNQKFNLEPLLSDICGIYAALTRTEARINDFITRAGRVRDAHFTHQWNESPPVQYDGPTPTITAGGRQMSFTRKTESLATLFHAQMRFNYNYSAYQLEHARGDALLDALGVNMTPIVIWNAIPWSFVVDWVLGVNRYLETLTVHNMEPQVNILRYMWSVRRIREITVTRQVDGTVFGTTAYYPSVSNLPIVREEAYRRFNTSPAGTLIQLGGLSPTEFTLGAALVLAQKHRPKRINLKRKFK